MVGVELDSLKSRVEVDRICNKRRQIVVILLEDLDCLNLPHFFHFDVVEVVLLILLLVAHTGPFGLEVPLEDHKVEFSVLRR